MECFRTPLRVYSDVPFAKSQLWFTCIIHWTVLRGCALSNGDSLRNLPGKVKSVPPSTIPLCTVERFFFSAGKITGDRAVRVDKAYDAASRRIRGTFAAPFRPTKLQRDFHKAQRRAENTPVIRGAARAGGAESSEMEEKLRYPCRENSRRELSLSSLFRPRLGRAAIPSAYQKAKKSWQLAVYDHFYEVYVSLASRKVEVSNSVSLEIKIHDWTKAKAMSDTSFMRDETFNI